MNIPLELADSLNWRNTEPKEVKLVAIDVNRRAAVDYYMSTMYPVVEHMIQFGVDYHNFMDNNDPVGLLEFIDKYKDSKYTRLAKFANGLQMDIEAVKNTLLYPDISNGIVEGVNSLVKCIKRVCGSRAKIDLLAARTLLRQQDKKGRQGEKGRQYEEISVNTEIA